MNVLHKKINSDFLDSLNVHSFSYIMFVMSTIKYPNAISTINTTQQKSYSSRGMRLENDINDSNKYYRELDKALIYKKAYTCTSRSCRLPPKTTGKNYRSLL